MKIYEKQGGTYRKAGDFLLPNLKVSTNTDIHIGVWGERRRRYLKEHFKVRYYNLLTSGTLEQHLSDIDQQAEEMFNQLVDSLSEKENINETLKATDPMKWIQSMNNIRNRATEIVYAELIYI